MTGAPPRSIPSPIRAKLWTTPFTLPRSVAVPTASQQTAAARGKKLEIGVRPEFVRFADDGVPVRIERAADVGRFRIVDARAGEQLIKLIVAEGAPLPEGAAHLAFDPARTRVYADGWVVA